MAIRSYNTEEIILRKIAAFNKNNSVIPALQTLTTDGRGGTFWAIPSCLGGLPSYNVIKVDNLPYVADLSYNTLYLSSATGIGMTQNSTTKQIDLYSKCFGYFDVSGGNTLTAFSNSVVQPRVKFVGTGGVSISSDPLTNTLSFSAANPLISTGIYGYHQINLISNTAEPTNNSYINATSPSTILTTAGRGDITLLSYPGTTGYSIGISTFTSRGYLDISGAAYGTFSSCLSTVSTLFYDIPMTGNATSSLLSFTSNVSTGINTGILSDRQNVMNNYATLGLVQTQGNTITTLSNSINTLNTGLLSSISFYSTLQSAGVPNTTLGVVVGTDCTVSSLSFSLNSMTNILQKNPTITIDYKPSILFSATTNVGNLQTVSTFLQAGKSILGTFTRPWISMNASGSNIYADSVTLNLNSSDVNQSLQSTYTLCHRVNGFTGYSSSNTSNSTSLYNALAVRLNQVNYNGL